MKSRDGGKYKKIINGNGYNIWKILLCTFIKYLLGNFEIKKIASIQLKIVIRKAPNILNHNLGSTFFCTIFQYGRLTTDFGQKWR